MNASDAAISTSVKPDDRRAARMEPFRRGELRCLMMSIPSYLPGESTMKVDKWEQPARGDAISSNSVTGRERPRIALFAIAVDRFPPFRKKERGRPRVRANGSLSRPRRAAPVFDQVARGLDRLPACASRASGVAAPCLGINAGGDPAAP